MLTKFRREDPLDAAIHMALGELELHRATSEEYAKTLDHLVKLYKLKEAQTSRSLSPDTKATVAANLIGILLIIRHENVNVIASKALGFVARTK